MQGFCQSLRRIRIDFMSCTRNELKLSIFQKAGKHPGGFLVCAVMFAAEDESRTGNFAKRTAEIQFGHTVAETDEVGFLKAGL